MRGREGERVGAGERVGERVGEREGGWEGGREGEREWERGRERGSGREGGRDGGRERELYVAKCVFVISILTHLSLEGNVFLHSLCLSSLPLSLLL